VNRDEKVARLQDQIDTAPQNRDGTLADWSAETGTMMRLFLGEENDNFKQFQKIRYNVMVGPSSEEIRERAFRSGVARAISLVRAAITEISLMAEMSTSIARVPEPGNEIFVVHGHNEAFRLKVVDFLSKATDRPPTVLIDEANKGMELFEKFEDAAGRACFAVVLATADDIGRAKTGTEDKDRARQNVILEWGFFAGRLGRDRVALMCEPGVELPSDIGGLVYIPLDPAGAWRLNLAKELKAAKIDARLDRAI
jgi:predicted nucleotide-binding protein